MSKYEPLGQFLRNQTRDQIPMTFAEIEKILGAPLPASKMHRAWWSNNPSNNVMTREWLAAGYETENVELAAGRLVFRRKTTAESESPVTGLHPIFGCMKGKITLAPGFDPAAPASEDWSEDPYIGVDRP